MVGPRALHSLRRARWGSRTLARIPGRGQPSTWAAMMARYTANGTVFICSDVARKGLSPAPDEVDRVVRTSCSLVECYSSTPCATNIAFPE